MLYEDRGCSITSSNRVGPTHQARSGRLFDVMLFLCGACGFGWTVPAMKPEDAEEEEWFCPKCGHCQHVEMF